MAQSDRLFLEDTSSSLQQALETKLKKGKEIQEQDFQDFEVNYWVSSDEENLQFIIRYPYLQEVLPNGSQELLEHVWDGLPLSLKVEGGQLEVGVQMAALGEDMELRERCATQLLKTRVWLLIGPLQKRLMWLRDATATKKGGNSTVASTATVPAPVMVQVRQLESCWIICKPDRILVIFTIHLDDEVDVALGRAFCQEFAETGRKASDSSLPCTFTEPKEPPADLRGMTTSFTPNVGYISMTLSDQCLRNATEDRVYDLARNVMTFRNFFNFHLKNAKSYLHSRLRKRLDGWQQTMNRAKRAPRKNQETVRRTMGGKQFTPAPRT